jgi:hypothetical protein
MESSIITFISWVSTSVIINYAWLQNRSVSSDLFQSKWGPIFSATVLSLFFGFPWFRLIFANSIKHQSMRKFVFSYLSLGIAIIFYKPISTAPGEGILINIILCLFLIILAYPCTMIFNKGASKL